MAGLPGQDPDDFGGYPTKCSEGRDLERHYQADVQAWLPVHVDDGTTCDHPLDHATTSTAATRALLLLL